MLNKSWSLFLGIVFSCAMPAVAQVSDTSKTDSIKVDTAMLNKFRADSRKNALPVRIRPILITPELVPVSLPDYTFSYWHKAILFNLNFNQAGFTNNWSGGGVNSVALGANFDYKIKPRSIIPTSLTLFTAHQKIKGKDLEKQTIISISIIK